MNAENEITVREMQSILKKINRGVNIGDLYRGIFVLAIQNDIPAYALIQVFHNGNPKNLDKVNQIKTMVDLDMYERQARMLTTI